MTKFGVAGNSQSCFDEGYTETAQAAKWCASRDIDFFEYSFGKGILLREETARLIGKAFHDEGLEMTVHAPYYINFANTDPLMIEKSIDYVLNSAKKVRQMQGRRVVFHPAAQGKLSREDAVAITKTNLLLLKERIIEAGFDKDFIFCPETMGKMGQIGTVDEVIEFCKLSNFFYPCCDFGHINARGQGILKDKKDFSSIICRLKDELPFEKVEKMHVHFSKIEYGKKGELRHLTFEDTRFGPEFEPFAEAMIEHNLAPYIVSESAGTQAEDAIFMKKTYFSFLK